MEKEFCLQALLEVDADSTHYLHLEIKKGPNPAFLSEPRESCVPWFRFFSAVLVRNKKHRQAAKITQMKTASPLH